MKNEDSENKNLYVKPPSLFKMLKTFTEGVGEFIKKITQIGLMLV